ncbi:MAG: RNA polymerase sigma factor [Archangium sp.]
MDAANFEHEVQQCRPQLEALARRMVGHPEDARDVVQDALLKATKSLHSFRGGSSIRTWLYAVTTRTAIDHLRAAKRWNNQAMVDACDPRAADSVKAKFSADASARFDVNQHISLCFTCVGRSLEPEQQAALVLSEVFGLTDREGAEALELTEPKYRHLLGDAREHMRSEFENLCALVNKKGACHQCRILRDLAPSDRNGPAAPEHLDFDQRLAKVKATEAAQTGLNTYFFQTLKALQTRR